MLALTALLIAILAFLASSTLLIDYTATDDLGSFGTCQLEGADGDKVQCPGSDNTAFIRPETVNGKSSLHFHREADYRRAEVKGKGTWEEGKTYYCGFQFLLANVHEHLAIFQWKNGESDEHSNQNIIFNLQFTENSPTRLSLGYTAPGGNDYNTIWTDSSDFSTTTPHSIVLAWSTASGSTNKVQLWLDGASVFEKNGLSLWTGDAYPKWGIYRGEQGDHDAGGGDGSSVFDLYLYRVQVSDESLEEVEEAGGVSGNGAVNFAVLPAGTGGATGVQEGLVTKTRAAKKGKKTATMEAEDDDNDND